MKTHAVILGLSVLALAGRAEAANFAVITSPPTILNLAVMFLGVAGVVVGIQLINILKGGFLSRAWQIFVAGFAVVILAQLAILLPTFEIIDLPAWVAPGLTVLWAGVFFYGIFETKRILA